MNMNHKSMARGDDDEFICGSGEVISSRFDRALHDHGHDSQQQESRCCAISSK